jgi:adenosylcobyric acid synthase
VEGGEIGRAQALQAKAAKVAPSIHMNPVLLKPETTTGAQVIVQGERLGSFSAREFMAIRTRFLPNILDSFHKLAAEADLVLVEGAGSPAEINLRQGDIANMGFAAAAGIPAVLVGDIHRGGVIAAIAGTFEVLDSADTARLHGFLINNFHGDPALFCEGRHFLESRTGRPCLGVVPHFPEAARLPAEDAVALDRRVIGRAGEFVIAVPKLQRIANFDDLDPLRLEPGVSVEFVEPGRAIPAEARLIILPGSKSTIGDLGFFRAQGWDIDLKAHVRRGGHVLGLCGGYQMLGKVLHDPEGLEGPAGSAEGLGLLDVETVLEPSKTLRNVEAVHMASGASLRGYEIHLGRTVGPDCSRPFAAIAGRTDGAVSLGGRVAGTYLHGCFVSDEFRKAYLEWLGAAPIGMAFDHVVEETIDRLADHLERHLNVARLMDIAQPLR